MTFADFWQAYPRKINKSHALKAWNKAIKVSDAQTIIHAATHYAHYVRGSEPKHICHPATWLNQCRFENDYTALAADNNRKSATGLAISAAIAVSQKNAPTMGQPDRELDSPF